MGARITIGQYVASESAVHRTDTRVKLVLAGAYAIALFLANGWIGLAICGALAGVGYALAHLPLSLAFRGLKPVLCILVFTIALNTITFDAGTSAGADVGAVALIGAFGISLQGLASGLFFALRIVLLIAATSLITYTSSLVDIVDAIRSLLRPLARLKVPVEDVAIVCAMTLRFIPSTVEAAERIAKAQQSRGLRLDEGGLLARAKAWIPIVTPLFISMFRRADTLAAAMDARCYTGNARTHLHVARIKRADSFIGALGVALLACIAVFL
ncbi:energy-coupling factor transporter transmembrane component T family protein [Raoultibacter phocaeensis]|uniref:energy-coupling factor transporter transmembrane component T family protein n=1 Tax=Raoultibacter phocaeensis TaxID=2479841 RepID=UPI00111A3F12|nr:energy-coupling factor transporter transmembrane component T [Raoultibacter phocaeensis]